MLYLNPPYYIIDGVSIFPDDSDPLQYYFLPMMPHLSTTKDPATGNDVPVIQLIEYEGSAGAGGFINFDVNLGIDPDALQDVAAKLKRQAHLSDAGFQTAQGKGPLLGILHRGICHSEGERRRFANRYRAVGAEPDVIIAGRGA